MEVSGSPSRFRKTWTCLLVIAVPLMYLFGGGPWSYMYSDLPPWGQGLVTLMYYPLPWLVYESGFTDTWVGNCYMHYLVWWADLRE